MRSKTHVLSNGWRIDPSVGWNRACCPASTCDQKQDTDSIPTCGTGPVALLTWTVGELISVVRRRPDGQHRT